MSFCRGTALSGEEEEEDECVGGEVNGKEGGRREGGRVRGREGQDQL